MRVSILKLAGSLIASLQPGLSDREWLEFRDQLSAEVGRLRVHGVIVDVTLLDVLDSFAVRTLRNVAATCRLRGAETVVVGIQPDVAFAMARLGLNLSDVATGLDLEEGHALLAQRRRGTDRREE